MSAENSSSREITLLHRRSQTAATETLHYDSTIDAEHLACDVGRLRRCKKCYGVGNFFYRRGSSERDFSVNRFLDVIGKSGGHVRGNKTRRHCVDSNVAARQLARKRLGESDQACFAGGIICLAGVTHQADHRTDVDDAATALLR